MSLLQVSVSGGVMVIVITLIRALAINHFPKKTFLIMWGIVLLRLLLPYSFPSSLSIYSFINLTNWAGEIPFDPAVHFLPIVTIFPTGTNAAASAFITAKNFPWIIAWLTGMTLCSLYFILAYVKCRNEFKCCPIVENDYIRHWLKDNKLKRTVTIRQTGRVTAPLTYGILHPVILMPEHIDWTDTKKLQYVLAHEYAHIKRFDIVTKVLFTVALCIHWFNPLVWIMYILSNRDMELSCDEAVLRSFGETIKSAYALALINMEEQKRQATPFCNSFSKNAIEERIKAIMKTQRATKAGFCISIAAILFVAIPFATNAQALAIPVSDEGITSSEPAGTKFVLKQPKVTAFTLDASNIIAVPVSVRSLGADTAICVGEVPNIADMSELKYEVHAPEGTGTLYAAMRKPHDDTGPWFNQVGMFGEGKTGRDIVWKMDGNSDEDFGYDEGYSGNYIIYIISENGNLSDISGSITITYDEASSRQRKVGLQL